MFLILFFNNSYRHIDPILVTGDVTQQERNVLQPGAPGTVHVITGEQVEGRIRYISAESDEATRTFRVELEVPNPEGALVAGLTAQATVPTLTARAHKLSSALLSLNRDQDIGIKSVNNQNRVAFHKIDIVRAAGDGIWVTGLPETIDIITVGHGFVREGDEVTPRRAQAAMTATPATASPATSPAVETP